MRVAATARTTTELGVSTAESVATRVLDGALTHIDQKVAEGDRVMGVVGDDAWLLISGTLVVLPDVQVARMEFGERRSSFRLLHDLATRRDVGARTNAEGELVLFDDAGELCVLSLGDDALPKAMRFSDAVAERRYEYDEWKSFGGLVVPARYREIGARATSVEITACESLATFEPKLFRAPG
ncbi:MAG: hypothetical protein R3F34_01425 [Planctomycetota bacterium]